MDPADLVVKYKEYVHGNRLEMRRVVLSAAMLPDIVRAGNLRVIPPDDLLGRFLATFAPSANLQP